MRDLQDPIGGGEAQIDNPIPRIIVGMDNPTGPDGAVVAGPATPALPTTAHEHPQYRAAANLDAGAHS